MCEVDLIAFNIGDGTPMCVLFTRVDGDGPPTAFKNAGGRIRDYSAMSNTSDALAAAGS